MLFLNGRSDKLSDKRVRKALAHAIDVDQIIETVYAGLAVRFAVPVHPSATYYKSDLQPLLTILIWRKNAQRSRLGRYQQRWRSG